MKLQLIFYGSLPKKGYFYMTLHFIFIPETLVSSFHPSTFSVFRAVTYLEEIHVSHLNFDVTTQKDLSLCL